MLFRKLKPKLAKQSRKAAAKMVEEIFSGLTSSFGIVGLIVGLSLLILGGPIGGIVVGASAFCLLVGVILAAHAHSLSSSKPSKLLIQVVSENEADNHYNKFIQHFQKIINKNRKELNKIQKKNFVQVNVVQPKPNSTLKMGSFFKKKKVSAAASQAKEFGINMRL